jgi:hypothetical protein
LELNQNIPNPFKERTKIYYSIPQSGWVRVEVFNIMGQKVRTIVNGYKSAGNHQKDFYSKGLPEGIYLCRIMSMGEIDIRAMIHIK